MTNLRPLSTCSRTTTLRTHHHGGDDEGFTLIELMVVLLVIAILLAIAIPTFLGVSTSANDRAAQSNLTNALTEAKALYQNTQTYNSGSLPQATFAASAPEFSWTQNGACSSGGTSCVSEYPVDVQSSGDGRAMILASLSKTGTCWYVVDLESAPSSTSFTDSGGGATYQFLSGTTTAGTAPQTQQMGGSALTSAGVYYAKKTTSTCNASTPVTETTASWKWGTSYSSAGSD
ncbi:MAG: type II secretion system protein [Acidimicrobiales bacterium]|jgi:type IV pilus assembly protein PilA